MSAVGIPISVGINHGAIQLLPDDADHPGIVGDAIGVASSIADYGGPEKITTSRAFADALAEANPVRAQSLCHAGTYTDGQVRTHELFTPQPGARRKRRKLLFATGSLMTGLLLGSALSLKIRHYQQPHARKTGRSFDERWRDAFSR